MHEYKLWFKILRVHVCSCVSLVSFQTVKVLCDFAAVSWLFHAVLLTEVLFSAVENNQPHNWRKGVGF